MTKITAAIVGALIGLILPIQLAFADGSAVPEPLSKLTGEWWQWALSIPTDQNPQTDMSGDDCMVGQRGLFGIWPESLVAEPSHARVLSQRTKHCFSQ